MEVNLRTVKSIARQLGISKENLARACKQGIVRGATFNKDTRQWHVPEPLRIHYTAQLERRRVPD